MLCGNYAPACKRLFDGFVYYNIIRHLTWLAFRKLFYKNFRGNRNFGRRCQILFYNPIVQTRGFYQFFLFYLPTMAVHISEF